MAQTTVGHSIVLLFIFSIIKPATGTSRTVEENIFIFDRHVGCPV